jgi:multidrug efflux pump subunit AcrB
MVEVIGIDHIYVTVSDLDASEQFYDRVMIEVLAFRKNKFSLAGDPHIQYFNRYFGFVLRPSMRSRNTTLTLQVCITFACASIPWLMFKRLRINFAPSESTLQHQGRIQSTQATT